MLKQIMNSILIMAFAVPTLANSNMDIETAIKSQIADNSQKITEIKSIRSQLKTLKIKRGASIVVAVTAGVVAAVSLWSRVASLTEDGLKYFQPSRFNKPLDIATVISGSISGGAYYYATLKIDEIEDFENKLARAEELLIATQAGLESAK